MPHLSVIAARRGAGMILGAVLLSLTPAMAADLRFETELGPTPINHATMGAVTGHGSATATLEGDRFNVRGTFGGLATPATDAHIMLGSGIGIPGAPVLGLTVSAAADGTLAGTFTLTRAQVAALQGGRLYIQINSQKAPAPGGNLWGWLLPEHKKAGQDEPQMGDWFLPQGKGLKAPASGRQS